MYGSLFGTHHEQDASSCGYVEASGTGTTKTLNSQISLPPLHGNHNDWNNSGSDSGGLVQSTSSASISSCVVNLTNTIIGAGMLGLPGALGGTGYVGGILLMVVGACFSAHGLLLLSLAAQSSGLPSSFYSVAHAAVPHYTILIDAAVALKCFGVATGYLITVGDCMVEALHPLANNQDQSTMLVRTILSRQFWIVGAILAVLPVSFYKTLNELKKASALALVFVVLLVFGIVAYASGWADPCLDYLEGGDDDGQCRGDMEAFTTPAQTMAKVPIFVFAFTCHQNIFPIVNEIEHRTQDRINTVILWAIGVALAVFAAVAIEGYRTFGSNVRGDILLNYPGTPLVTVLRICIAVMLTLHYPLQLDPARRCITSLVRVVRDWRRQPSPSTTAKLFHQRDSELETSEHSDPYMKGEFNEDGDNQSLFYTITIVFLLLSFGLAMVVKDLGVVLAMVGATGSTLVSYILPGLIYLKIAGYRIGAVIQLAMGCFIMPVALYFVLMGNIHN